MVLFPEHGDDPASYDHDAVGSEQGEPIMVLRHLANTFILHEHGCTISTGARPQSAAISIAGTIFS